MVDPYDRSISHSITPPHSPSQSEETAYGSDVDKFDWEKIYEKKAEVELNEQDDPFPFRIAETKIGHICSQREYSYSLTVSESKDLTKYSKFPCRYVTNIPFRVTNYEDTARKVAKVIRRYEEDVFVGYENPLEELRYRTVLVIGFNTFKSLLEDKDKICKKLASPKFVRDKEIKNLCPIHLIGFLWEPVWEEKLKVEPRNRATENGWRTIPFTRVSEIAKKLLSTNQKELVTKRIAEEEKKIGRKCIPFGGIRDYIKDHLLTQKSVELFKHTNGVHIYLHTLDSDIKKLLVEGDKGVFKGDIGVFTGYEEFMRTKSIFPDCLSGNYRISMKENMLLHWQCELLRRIQKAISNIFPTGIYFSETNLLIKIPKEKLTLPESFGKGNSEALHFIQNIKANRRTPAGELPLICFVPRVAVTTTRPYGMEELPNTNAYVYDGKLRCWDQKTLIAMREVIKLIKSTEWAHSVKEGLPKPRITGQKFTDTVNSALAQLFICYDPLSYASKFKSAQFYAQFIQALKPNFREIEKQENAQKSLEILSTYYDEATLKEILMVAQKSGKVIGNYFAKNLDLDFPQRDYFDEEGFKKLEMVKQPISREEILLFKRYTELSKEAWKMQYCSIVGDDADNKILSRLHIATLKNDTVTVKKLTEEGEDVNATYLGKMTPLQIALDLHRDPEIIFQLLMHKGTLNFLHLSSYKLTPFQIAIFNLQLDKIEDYLRENEDNIDKPFSAAFSFPCYCGCPALMWAFSLETAHESQLMPITYLISKSNKIQFQLTEHFVKELHDIIPALMIQFCIQSILRKDYDITDDLLKKLFEYDFPFNDLLSQLYLLFNENGGKQGYLIDGLFAYAKTKMNIYSVVISVYFWQEHKKYNDDISDLITPKELNNFILIIINNNYYPLLKIALNMKALSEYPRWLLYKMRACAELNHDRVLLKSINDCLDKDLSKTLDGN